MVNPSSPFFFLFHDLVSKSTGITFDWCDPPKGLGTFDIILAFEWYVFSLYLHYYALCGLVVVTCITPIPFFPSF